MYYFIGSWILEMNSKHWLSFGSCAKNIKRIVLPFGWRNENQAQWNGTVVESIFYWESERMVTAKMNVDVFFP